MHFDEKFFVGLAFVIFMALIARPIGKVITSALDKRSARIKAELEEALRLKEEAQALLVERQRAQRLAVEEANEMITHAREEVERITKLAREQLETELARKTEMTMDKIAQAEAAVLQDIRDHTMDIITSAARQLILDHMSKDVGEELLQQAISDIQRKFH